jgi:hypothetical protein
MTSYIINSLIWSLGGFVLGAVTAVVWLRERKDHGAATVSTVAGVMLVVFSLVGAFVAVGAQAQGDRRQACIEEWATAYTARGQALGDLSTERLDALDALVRAVAINDPEVFQMRLDAYLAASDEYRKQVKDVPVPVPDLDCR